MEAIVMNKVHVRNNVSKSGRMINTKIITSHIDTDYIVIYRIVPDKDL